MLKSKFGKRFESFSNTIGLFFSKLGIPPNGWTLLTLVFAVPGFLALYKLNLLLGFIFFFISGCIDLIDGSVARATKTTTNFGAFLDGVVDRYVEFLLYLGLWFYIKDLPEFLFSNTVWVFLLLFGALMPSFIRAYAHHRGVVVNPKELEEMGGLLERSERLDLLYLGMLSGFFSSQYIVYAVALVAVLCHLTSLQRILHVLGKQ
ncbi:MAG: CDP-alcohol phosphatidyltransferase family protein [Candidatus Altiarchaeales archaeon]|nr:CDP-alcohol phosphatidyltransferase family protein [Candidatus Altiarchaeales archaeon]